MKRGNVTSDVVMWPKIPHPACSKPVRFRVIIGCVGRRVALSSPFPSPFLPFSSLEATLFWVLLSTRPTRGLSGSRNPHDGLAAPTGVLHGSRKSCHHIVGNPTAAPPPFTREAMRFTGVLLAEGPVASLDSRHVFL